MPLDRGLGRLFGEVGVVGVWSMLMVLVHAEWGSEISQVEGVGLSTGCDLESGNNDLRRFAQSECGPAVFGSDGKTSVISCVRWAR